MSLRMRVRKLVENRRMASKKNYFIIATSLESEEEQVANIKESDPANQATAIFTVFKLYG